MDIANYTIPIPALGKFCLLPYLQGQPIRFMAYDRMSHLHAWNMEVCCPITYELLRSAPDRCSEVTSQLSEKWSELCFRRGIVVSLVQLQMLKGWRRATLEQVVSQCHQILNRAATRSGRQLRMQLGAAHPHPGPIRLLFQRRRVVLGYHRCVLCFCSVCLLL